MRQCPTRPISPITPYTPTALYPNIPAYHAACAVWRYVFDSEKVIFLNLFDMHLIIFEILGGALAGKQNLFYCLAPNPVAGENCSHFSILGNFENCLEL